MEQYFEPTTHTLYWGSWKYIIDNVVADLTGDLDILKRELKGAEAVIAELRRMNDRQSDTITDYQTKTEVLYKENMILKMKNNALVDEKKELEKQNVYFSNELAKERTLRQNAEHENEELKNTIVDRDATVSQLREIVATVRSEYTSICAEKHIWKEKWEKLFMYCRTKCPYSP